MGRIRKCVACYFRKERSDLTIASGCSYGKLKSTEQGTILIDDMESTVKRRATGTVDGW